MSFQIDTNLSDYFASYSITLDEVKKRLPDPSSLYHNESCRNMLLIYLMNPYVYRVDDDILEYLSTPVSIRKIASCNTNVLTAYLRKCGINVNMKLFDMYVSVEGACTCRNVTYNTTALNAYLRNKNNLDVNIVRQLANDVSINNYDINERTALANYLHRYDNSPVDVEIINILANSHTIRYMSPTCEPVLNVYLQSGQKNDVSIVDILIVPELLTFINENGHMAIHHCLINTENVSMDIVKKLANETSIQHKTLRKKNALSLYYEYHSDNIDDSIVKMLYPYENTVVYDNDNECIICMEKMEMYTMDILECKHAFHYKCMNEWKSYSKRAQCPMCRDGK